MRAVVKMAPGDGNVEYREDWPEPAPRAGWVIADVLACGVCGTDLHILHDRFTTWPPVVMGHELVAEIAEIGEGVEGWSVGDRVVCELHALACGHCDLCRRGLIHLCRSKRPPGGGIDGAFAEKVSLPAHLLHRVPDGVSSEAAVITEPLAICVTAVDRGATQPGELALVIGPGPVGLLTALVLKASGVDVVLAGRASSADRLALAESLGIETCAADEDVVVPLLNSKNTRVGADIVFEASGSEAGMALAIEAVRRAGRIVVLGLTGGATIGIRADEAMRKSLDLRFSMSSEYSSWDRALALLANGSVDPRPLLTTYPLVDWEKAFEAVSSRSVVKAVISDSRQAPLDSISSISKLNEGTHQ